MNHVNSKKVVVAVSLGGTKLAVGLVDNNGPIPPWREADWRGEFRIGYGPKDQDNEPVRDAAEKNLMRGISKLVEEAVLTARKDGHNVAKIGVATKGPMKKGSDSNGRYVIVGPCTTVPFKECMLDRELKKALRSSISRSRNKYSTFGQRFHLKHFCHS